MIFLKSIMLVLLLGVIPVLLGKLVVYKDTSEHTRSVIVKYAIGLFTSLALFWILCLIMTFLKVTFSILTIVYTSCILLLSVIAIIVCYRKREKRNWEEEWNAIKPNSFEFIYIILFLLFLGVQVYFAIFYEVTINSYDDVTYVVLSQDAISSNHIYLSNEVTGNLMTNFNVKRVLNSWPIYIAYLSKMSGFHVTTISHTIIPVLFLLIAYGVYYYLASCLLKERENRLIFLCVLSVLFIFGFYSSYSLTFRFLATLWQGKAVLSVIVLPFLFAFLPRVYEQKFCWRNVVYLVLISMAACSLTMMASGMSIAVYVGMWLVFIIYKRRFTGTGYCFWGCIIPAMQMVVYLLMR